MPNLGRNTGDIHRPPTPHFINVSYARLQHAVRYYLSGLKMNTVVPYRCKQHTMLRTRAAACPGCSGTTVRIRLPVLYCGRDLHAAGGSHAIYTHLR